MLRAYCVTLLVVAINHTAVVTAYNAHTRKVLKKLFSL